MTRWLATGCFAALAGSGCVATHHAARPSELGVPRSSDDLLAVLEQPGPVTVETINSADWAVDRSGLINLDHPQAKAAGLKDGLEPVQIYFHVLRHPIRGMYIVDTGVETLLRDHPEQAAVRGLVASFMHLERMQIHAPLGEWLRAHPEPLQGVFFTHLHLDHITGAADLPAGTPVYTGPGEAGASGFLNLFVQGSADRALEGKPELEELSAQPDPARRFSAVVDVFGDGSLWALWVPGHTPGSMAYLARTPKGPVLLVGDTCHTVWGWQHGVEPGSFTADRAKNAASLARLRQLVADHPAIDVRLGHQALPAP